MERRDTLPLNDLGRLLFFFPELEVFARADSTPDVPDTPDWAAELTHQNGVLATPARR